MVVESSHLDCEKSPQIPLSHKNSFLKRDQFVSALLAYLSYQNENGFNGS